jgi:hypothetical protein
VATHIADVFRPPKGGRFYFSLTGAGMVLFHINRKFLVKLKHEEYETDIDSAHDNRTSLYGRTSTNNAGLRRKKR